MYKILCLCLIIFIFKPVFSQTVVEKNFKPVFEKYGVDGCFVLYDQTDNKFIKYSPSLCDSGYIPASTFKIPHSLIALEEGVVKDTNQVIKWDSIVRPVKVWNHDQTLKTAVKYSCVWVFSGFTKQISTETYQKYIDEFQYGNMNITGVPSHFWLAGLLRISANQQIDFLRKFYNYELPVSKRSIDIVKNIIVLDNTGKYKLSGKTGGGMMLNNKYIMWLVGYLEVDNKPYFYAMNFITDDFDKASKARYDITKDVFRELGLIK